MNYKFIKYILFIVLITVLVNVISKKFNMDINTCYNIAIMVMLCDISIKLYDFVDKEED